MNRRAFLVGVLGTAFAGCLSGQDSAGNGTETETTIPRPTRPRLTSPQATATSREVVSVERTITDDEIDYDESNGSVRYVIANENPESPDANGTVTRERVYTSQPFAEWARVECHYIGLEHVESLLETRLDGKTGGITAGVTTRGDTKTIVVSYSTTLNREGEVTAKPAVSIERLRHVVPTAVVVRLSLDGRTHRCRVPVEAERVTGQLE